MHGLKVEHRPITNKSDLARDIAEHIAKDTSHRTTVVVTDRPKHMLAEIKQAWGTLLQQYEQQLSLADDKKFKEELNWRIARMKNRTFSAEPPGEILQANITLSTPQAFLRYSPICQVMYVACSIKQEELYLLTAWMFGDGVVVDYREKEARSREKVTD